MSGESKEYTECHECLGRGGKSVYYSMGSTRHRMEACAKCQGTGQVPIETKSPYQLIAELEVRIEELETAINGLLPWLKGISK